MNAPAARFTTAQLVAQLVALVTTAAADLRGWCEIAPTRQAAAMLAAAAMLWRRVVSNPSTPCSFDDLDAHEREALAKCEEQGWLLRCDVAGECLDPPDITEAVIARAPYRTHTETTVKRAWVITPEGEALASAWHEAAVLHAPQLTDAQRAALFSATPESHREERPEERPPPRVPPPSLDPYAAVDELFEKVRDHLALSGDDEIKLSVRAAGTRVRAVLRVPMAAHVGALRWQFENDHSCARPSYALREVGELLPPPAEAD